MAGEILTTKDVPGGGQTGKPSGLARVSRAERGDPAPDRPHRIGAESVEVRVGIRVGIRVGDRWGIGG
jgi:hypothetical protein